MSARPVPEVARDLERLQRSLTDAGVGGMDPLMPFLVLSLPVIPELRMTNRGLVDVETQKIIPVVLQ
jgi:adenine deaminase